jgi:hypothetical protein
MFKGLLVTSAADCRVTHYDDVTLYFTKFVSESIDFDVMVLKNW